jgi:1-hydroxycarotenoid 3,4-desaturase
MKQVVVVGAGMGGLSAALDLARRGFAVTVLERADGPGGKMREVLVDGAAIDAGPTVFTMRGVFDDLFRSAGTSLEEEISLTTAHVLARHAWTSGGALDLFADREESAEAIRAFSDGKNSDGYRKFCAAAADMFATLDATYMRASKPNQISLAWRVGIHRIGALMRTRPFATLWQELDRYFTDPRLRQLFARYATYVGSSPLLAPATLMLIAHVEQEGVWRVAGGMRRVAEALARVGGRCGANYRYNTHVARIETTQGAATQVVLGTGEVIRCDAVVFNGDASALGMGLLGTAVSGGARTVPPEARSLSAVTWCMKAKTSGFHLSHHTVFFGRDYPAEFGSTLHAKMSARGVAAEPTVYICAQDRRDGLAGEVVPAEDRLLVLVNAPANGDITPLDRMLEADWYDRTTSVLSSCGLVIDAAATRVITAPQHFSAFFPGSGGALYGRANHGAMGSFQRMGARANVRRLYLAGGSVHPGAGVPMAALSGVQAAAAVAQDFGF